MGVGAETHRETESGACPLVHVVNQLEKSFIPRDFAIIVMLRVAVLTSCFLLASEKGVFRRLQIVMDFKLVKRFFLFTKCVL